MNTFTRSIKQVFAGAADAFKTFPASIGCALGFALVTIIRIQLEWPQQEPYNFLFNCLHWSFALGAIFSLMVITGAQSRYNTTKAFLLANVLGVASAGITFALLYFFAATNPEYAGTRYEVVSSLAVARVSMVMLISYLAFVVLAGVPAEKAEGEDLGTKERIDFSRSFFMSHKAFFIAAIYGVVIMSGTSGVARAVQALLYHDMSYKVYMYLGTITGFLVFTLFIGYFPDFRKGAVDERREAVQKQPRFVEILFGYIMVPIMMALSVVLLLWAGRTVMAGMDVPLVRLAGIAAAYTIGGIWLHIMVTNHETGLTKFYRKFYPVAALVILVFEAWALVNQLGKTGLKLTEYWFILVWIVAAAGAILLILLQSKAHTTIVAIVCALAVISVMPFVGYNVLPVNSQVDRLETLLTSENMLQDGKLVKAAEEPALEVRENITDAVDYLAYVNDAKLPEWFDKELGNDRFFRTTLGFDKVWPKDDFGPQPSDYVGISLYLPAGPIDISDYQWAINVQQQFEKQQGFITVDGVKGTYRIYWETNNQSSIPILEIQLDDKVIIKKDMNDYIDMISEKYPSGNMEQKPAPAEDMTLVLESEEVKVLLVFRNVEINVDPQNDNIYYGLNMESLYMTEK